jgi:lactate dehydrogenase-like 2-hydroxyacid dehydrogenase
MASRPIVIVTRRLPADAESALASSFDCRLNPADERFDETRMREAFANADAVLPAIGDRVSAEAIAGGRARLIANCGVGTDHIDLEAARRASVAVTNTPGVLTDCTADLAIGLIIAVMRRMGEAEREIRAGAWTGWRPTHMMGRRVSGAALGIIGFGRIGQAVARRAHHGFGMQVRFHTPHPPGPDVFDEIGARPAALESLLRESDVVSIHAPASPTTHHLLDARRIALMKPTAFLVNTARGEIVDETALLDALFARRIAGAGLDVFENEPGFRAEIARAPGVVMLPHIGSATIETRTAMAMRAVTNLQAWFRGDPPPDRVA